MSNISSAGSFLTASYTFFMLEVPPAKPQKNSFIKKYGKVKAFNELGSKIIATAISFNDGYKIFLEELLNVKRPNYDINLKDNYKYNKYYYKYYNFDSLEQRNLNDEYILMFDAIDSVCKNFINKNHEFNDIDELLDTLNDDYLTNYYILKSLKEYKNHDDTITNLQKMIFEDNKDDFINYVLINKANNITHHDVYEILFYRYDLDLSDISKLIKRYEIGYFELIKGMGKYINDLEKEIEVAKSSNNKDELKKSDLIKKVEMKFNHALKLLSIHYVEQISEPDVLRLIQMMKELKSFTNTDLNILDFVCNYKITSEQVGKETVDFILGDANEISYQNIYRYEKEISNIKYLDSNSMIKMFNALLSLHDKKLIFKFLESISKNTDIYPLKDIILNTNDMDLIAEYLFLRSDEATIKKVFKDKDTYQKYVISKGIAKTYDFKINRREDNYE